MLHLKSFSSSQHIMKHTCIEREQIVCLKKDDVMTKNYEDYVAKVTTLGADEVAKPAVKAKFIESYNNMPVLLHRQD
jgi:hypothetical protein